MDPPNPEPRRSVSDPRPSADDRPPWLALALAAAACLVYLASELYLLSGRFGFPLDDSWIHLQFARQLAAGVGLAYNPGGAWVPGTTAPLWTALLAPGFLLPAAAVLWSKLLGGVFFLATVGASARLAAALGVRPGLRRLAAVLVAASHWLVWSALSGLEIGLFSWLSLWGIVLHLRERADRNRPVLSQAVFALAALARPEGYLLLVLALADRLIGAGARRGLRAACRGLLPAAVVLLPTLVFYRLTGGSFLPTTFAVKAGAMGPPSAADFLPSAAYLRVVLGIVSRSQPVMLVLAAAGVLRLAALAKSGRSYGLLPALWPLGLAFAYAVLAPAGGPVVVGNFGRYYFPILPVVVVLGVLGLDWVARRLPARALRLRWLVVALALAPQLWGLYRGPLRYGQTVGNVEDSDVRAARWLAPRLPPEALLAVQDIGALKYFLPNPVIDLAGIVNPDILPYLRGGAAGLPSGSPGDSYWEVGLLRYLEQKRPDYLVVFPRFYPMITTATPGFDLVQAFPVPQNVTMAGDEIAIFSTPWTRYRLADPPEDG